MAQITLNYDARNTYAKKTIDYILSLGFFEKVSSTTKEVSLSESEDIALGNAINEGMKTKTISKKHGFKKP